MSGRLRRKYLARSHSQSDVLFSHNLNGLQVTCGVAAKLILNAPPRHNSINPIINMHLLCMCANLLLLTSRPCSKPPSPPNYDSLMANSGYFILQYCTYRLQVPCRFNGPYKCKTAVIIFTRNIPYYPFGQYRSNHPIKYALYLLQDTCPVHLGS